jgi:hypothetical protein
LGPHNKLNTVISFDYLELSIPANGVQYEYQQICYSVSVENNVGIATSDQFCVELTTAEPTTTMDAFATETCDSIAVDDSDVCGENAAYDSAFASNTCAGPFCGSIDESTCCSCVCSPETDATASPSGDTCGEFVDRSGSEINGNIVDMQISFPYYFEDETIRADDDSLVPGWVLDETAMCTHTLSKDFFL